MREERVHRGERKFESSVEWLLFRPEVAGDLNDICLLSVSGPSKPLNQ
jgi:hypothetical protein